MAARTVVVKRPRRRLFAMLWQLPHWLRAVASASPRRRRPPDPAAGGGGMRPRLLWTAEGGHRCVGCGRCVELCPESALVRAADATLVGPGPEPRRWSLIDLLQAAPS